MTPPGCNVHEMQGKPKEEIVNVPGTLRLTQTDAKAVLEEVAMPLVASSRRVG